MWILLLLSYASLALFVYGFFLTRRELPLQGNHNWSHLRDIKTDATTLIDVIDQKGEGRISSPNRKRVFLFIVDALRLDFMVHRRDKDNIPHTSPYNKMKNLHNLLVNNASQSLLFGFRADPPTVTSQRLKSIMTGTLPTFIDIGANMNSSSITEDNIIDQLMNSIQASVSESCKTESGSNFETEKNTGTETGPEGEQRTPPTCHRKATTATSVVLGDDTWGYLFPTQFTETHLFDSFNTKDIDTVDNSIISHLFNCTSAATAICTNYTTKKTCSTEQEDSCHSMNRKETKENWDLMIAHFLGVDHIGHTYTAFHPLMAERLALMDTLLVRVIEELLPEDGLLFMFGDHGMTEGGEHGGGSEQETDSGLFVYSKQPLFVTNNQPSVAVYDSNTRSMRFSSSGSSSNCGSGSSSVFGSTLTAYWNELTETITMTPVDTIRLQPRIVPQLDLTPTLSLILGTPIPASSLGAIIPELFLNNMHNHDHDLLLNSAYINAMQVWRFLTSYWAPPTSSSAPSSPSSAGTENKQQNKATMRFKADISTHPDIAPLEHLLLRAINMHYQLLHSTSSPSTDSIAITTTTTSALGSQTEASERVFRAYTRFFREMQSFTREKWTRFKMPYIIVGIMGMLLFVIKLLHDACLEVYNCITPNLNSNLRKQDTGNSGHENKNNNNFKTNNSFCSHVTERVNNPIERANEWELAWAQLNTAEARLPIFLIIGAGFMSMAAYSDNFTIYEHLTAYFLFQGYNLLLGWQAFWFADRSGSERSALRRPLMIRSVILLVIVRALWWFTAAVPHRALEENSDSFSKYGICILVPIIAYAATKVYHRLFENSNCFREQTGSPYPGPIHGVCVALHSLSTVYLLFYWAVCSTHMKAMFISTKNWFLVGNPGSLESNLLSFLASAWESADWLIVLPRIILLLSSVSITLSVGALLETRVFTHKQDDTRAVQLSFLLHIYFSCITIMSLFSGSLYGSALLVWVVLTTLFVQSFQQLLCATRCTLRSSGEKDKTRSVFLVTVLGLYFPISARFLYFLTTHRMDFGTLQLSAGFIGNHAFDFICAGSALAANTFGAFVLGWIALYISLLYVQLKEDIRTEARRVKIQGIEQMTGCCVTDNPDNTGVRDGRVEDSHLAGRTKNIVSLLTAVRSVCVAYEGIVLLHSCLAAAILRRHLMVWRVFAPKMAFESCIWIAEAITVQILLGLIC